VLLGQNVAIQRISQPALGDSLSSQIQVIVLKAK
jgi:hypothetical protein